MVDIESIIQISVEAGDKILKFANHPDKEVVDKEDGSPVTAADLASHDHIVGTLSALSDYPIISEESDSSWSGRKSERTFWLVDPLDGTKDFIAGNGEYTVNIALIHEHAPILGVVHIPASQTTYFAQRGSGAFMRTDCVTKPIHYQQRPGELVCLDSRFHSSDKLIHAFCERYAVTALLKFGSSIKLCKIAEGVADVYPRFVPTKEWDTAAGHCVLKEAGGTVLDAVTHQELGYNKESLKNNSFVAWGGAKQFRL